MFGNDNLKFGRNRIICFILWTTFFIQLSAQLLSIVSPTQDPSSTDFLNVWIRLGLYPSENWFGFTAITAFVTTGSWFYKYITAQKPTLKKAAPFLKPIISFLFASILFMAVTKNWMNLIRKSRMLMHLLKRHSTTMSCTRYIKKIKN